MAFKIPLPLTALDTLLFPSEASLGSQQTQSQNLGCITDPGTEWGWAGGRILCSKHLFLGGQVTHIKNYPILLATTRGWVLSPAPPTPPGSIRSHPVRLVLEI